MRWLFADPSLPAEAASVRTTLAAIDRWWQAFQHKASELAAHLDHPSKLNLPRFMQDTLQAIDPNLMWEYGRAVRGAGRRLVITPEAERWLRPLVRTIVERAPKIAGWEFYAYRPPETAEEAVQTVKSRVGVDIAGVLIDAHETPDRKVNLHYAFPGKRTLDADTALQAAFVTTESLLGEQVLDNWIGEIDVGDASTMAPPPFLPPAQAQAAIASLIRGCIEQLPSVRRHELPPGRWTWIELEPPEVSDDYPARSDQFSAYTHDITLLRAIHNGQPFASSCHSRLGETFGYVKLDGQSLPREKLTTLRAELASALQAELASASMGCTIGGGDGLRYAYVDLALVDLKRAAAITRQVLVRHEVPLRSWLLFNDDDLADEWVGAYPQTPAPPENQG